ncbi:putative pseudouridine transporter, partial [Haemophilus influenzae]|jgi:uncharacterized protein YbjT (DUF2867 family)
VQ